MGAFALASAAGLVLGPMLWFKLGVSQSASAAVWATRAAGALLAVAPGTSLEAQLGVFAVFAVASALALRPTLKRLQGRVAASTLNASCASTAESVSSGVSFTEMAC